MKITNSLRTTGANLFTTLVIAASCASARADLSVDTSRREHSRVFYNSIYPASENVASGWNGNLSSGNAGTTSSAFKDAIFLRINFFRALAGIPGNITQNSGWNSKCQSAALMIAANKALDHTPPTSWKFYSEAGAEASEKSNLALSFFGMGAIYSYMEDPGASNEAVGHRRWILYPETKQMGTGDIPDVSGYQSANSLWVLDSDHFDDNRPTVRSTFIAWPPVGYVPYNFIFPRWSFSYPSADFSKATVSMMSMTWLGVPMPNGVPLPVRIESRTQGYGENAIVFVPGSTDPNAWNGASKPTSDTPTRVTVSNVLVGGKSKSFTYDVISFDPAVPGSDTPPFVIEGSSTPQSGSNNLYKVAPQVLATGYQWKYSSKAPYTVVTNAESDGQVAATGYSPRDSKVKSEGSYSFHLAHPNFVDSNFVLKDSFICSSSAAVNFYSKLTYATNTQTARLEVSTDGGNIWQSVWSQDGKNNPGESAFAKRTVSLSAFSGKEIKVRFNYDYKSGMAYTQTDQGVGWYVDAISFSGTEKLSGSVTSAVASKPEFTLNPKAGQSYSLQVRTQTYGKYFLGWSAVKTVKGK